MSLSRRTRELCLSSVLLVVAPLQGAAVWTLQGVTFDDFATAVGSFTYDALSNAYSNWNLSVTAGPSFTAYTYQPGLDAGFVGIHDASQVDFVAFPPATSGRYVRLTFVAALTDAGGSVSLKTDHTDWECDNCAIRRFITGGTVTTVPEPGGLMLVAAALAFAGLIARLRPAKSPY